MFTSLVSASLILGASLVSAGSPTWPAGVEGTGTQGVTNPTAPVTNTPINQDSMSRLLSINSIDDWCLFAPPTPNTIAESEQEEVAWCTKPRNNARLIPDGVFTGISFLKTDFYVQVLASGDFSKLNIQTSDTGGGELDPHGAQGAGNPIGGNVTTTITPNGSQLNVGEWMQFISSTQVCIRACTNANATFDAASMCEHKLDEMGCEFVMPGNYQFEGKYESCDADVAYPPGWYPTATVDGKVSFSTFAQYFTGVYTDTASSLVSYTVGTTATPQTAAFTPSSSNCKTVSSIANNMLSISGGSTITGTGSVTFATGVTSAAGSSTPTPTGTTSSAAGTGKAGSSSGASSSSSGTGKPTSGASSDSGKGGNGSTGTPGSNNTAATNSSAARRSLSGFFPGAGALLGVTLASVTAVLAGAVMVL